MQGLSPAAVSRGHSSSRCAGLSQSRPLSLRSTGSRRAGSAVVAHGPSHSTACGILPDQGPNPGPLHWQADSQPLRHQGSPHQVISNHVFFDLSQVLTHHILWTLYISTTWEPVKNADSQYLHFKRISQMMCMHIQVQEALF